MATETRTGGRSATAGVIGGGTAIAVGKPVTPTPDGFGWTALSEVARLETGHTPSRRHPEYWGGDIPWIGIKDATANHGRTIFSTNQTVTEAGIANSSARMLPTGTVCLSRTASVGYVVVMGVPMSTSQDFVNWVCGTELDNRYLKYVLQLERDTLLRFASGTTHQTIYFPEAKAFHALLPQIDEQRAIADVLGALDYKIESNRRLAEVVDELVRAEVAFAASGGRDAAVADLVSLIRTTVQPDSVPPATRYVGLEHMPRGRMILDSWGVAEGLGSGKAVFAPGDILFGKLRPYFKKVGLAPRGGGVCSTDVLVLRPTEPDLTAVALAVLASDDCIEFASNAASGTRMPRASWDHMKTYPVTLPPRDAVAKLAEFLDPLLAAAQRGVEESVVLAELRNALLPELLSGRLRVPVVEELVEAAT